MLETLQDNICIPWKITEKKWEARKINSLLFNELSIGDIQDNISIDIEDWKYDWVMYFQYKGEIIWFVEYEKIREWTIMIEYFSNINFNNNKLISTNPSYKNLSSRLSRKYFWNMIIDWLWKYMFTQFLMQSNIQNNISYIEVDALKWSERFYYSLWFNKLWEWNRLYYEKVN
jgi:hypothetical protein